MVPGGRGARRCPSPVRGDSLVAHEATLARTELSARSAYGCHMEASSTPRRRRSPEGRTRIGTPVDGEHVLASLSPSRAGDFRTCPLMYRLRTIDRLPEEPSPDALRGTVVHKVLEDLFDLAAADRTPERADEMVQDAWQFVLDAEPEVGGDVRRRLPGAPRSPRGWPRAARACALLRPRGPPPAGAGGAGALRGGAARLQLLLRGFVDRIDVAPDGAIRVVDYKTGRSPGVGFEAKALFQMRFYALVIWRTRGVVPALLRLVYLGDGQMVSYQPDEQDLLATERLVEAIWHAIERARSSGEWLPSPGWACRWCSFQAHCPTFGNEPPPLPDLTTALAPMPLRPQRRRRPVRDPDRAVDRGQVRLHRAFGDAQATGHLLVGQPLAHELEHLALARREVVAARTAAVAGREELPRDPGVQRRVTAGDRTDGVEQVLRVGVLQHVAHRPGVEHVDDPVGVGERGQHQHLGRARTDDLAGGADAVQLGHLQVHQDDVGLELGGAGHRLDAVRLADHLEVGVGREQLDQAHTHHRVVVDHEHTHRRPGMPGPGGSIPPPRKRDPSQKRTTPRQICCVPGRWARNTKVSRPLQLPATRRTSKEPLRPAVLRVPLPTRAVVPGSSSRSGRRGWSRPRPPPRCVRLPGWP